MYLQSCVVFLSVPTDLINDVPCPCLCLTSILPCPRSDASAAPPRLVPAGLSLPMKAQHQGAAMGNALLAQFKGEVQASCAGAALSAPPIPPLSQRHLAGAGDR